MLPAKFGRYVVDGVLGEGGMGVVYAATDPELARRVALKTIRMQGIDPRHAEELAARFHTEALAVGRLQHPNIVTIHDVGQEGITPFLVMELVQGHDLKRELEASHRIPLDRTLHIVEQLLSALSFAHKRGIIHRDIKPANILFDPAGQLKLGDFGAARIVDSKDTTRTRGHIVGTPHYMSPEQIQGQPIDARTDLFSTGVLLYQMLSGSCPFDGASEYHISHKILFEEPAPLDYEALGAPAALREVLGTALAKEPGKRFGSADAFLYALRHACNQAIPTRLDTAFPASSPWPWTAHALAEAGPTRKVTTRPGATGPGLSPHPIARPDAVRHELEREYWQDIRSSTDPQDDLDFLGRLPDGVYMELAKRHLLLLGHPGPEPPDPAAEAPPLTDDPDAGEAVDETRPAGTAPSHSATSGPAEPPPLPPAPRASSGSHDPADDDTLRVTDTAWSRATPIDVAPRPQEGTNPQVPAALAAGEASADVPDPTDHEANAWASTSPGVDVAARGEPWGTAPAPLDHTPQRPAALRGRHRKLLVPAMLLALGGATALWVTHGDLPADLPKSTPGTADTDPDAGSAGPVAPRAIATLAAAPDTAAHEVTASPPTEPVAADAEASPADDTVVQHAADGLPARDAGVPSPALPVTPSVDPPPPALLHERRRCQSRPPGRLARSLLAPPNRRGRGRTP